MSCTLDEEKESVKCVCSLGGGYGWSDILLDTETGQFYEHSYHCDYYRFADESYAVYYAGTYFVKNMLGKPTKSYYVVNKILSQIDTVQLYRYNYWKNWFTVQE